MKTATELLRTYASLVEAAENDFDAPDDGESYSKEDEVIDNEENPVDKLAAYIDENSSTDLSETIYQFLKEYNYDLVPSNGLENHLGNV
jgi:hypothetical protein